MAQSTAARGRRAARSCLCEPLELRLLLCYLPPITDIEPASTFEIEAAPPFPTSQTFLLHSRPSATKVIYLDFDGQVTSGTSWNSYTGGADFTTPAYSFEGTSSTFSANELERIQRIWQRVVEDFSPFDVDVTTQEPGYEDLRKSGTGDTRWGVRVVIGGSGAWYGSAGGVAYIGSFNWPSDTPCFVFEDNLSDGAEKTTAEAISHEVGHTVGLGHDGRSSPSEEYYYGHGSGETGWAPIMGVGYYQNLTQWSKGEYLNANRVQDDLDIITTQNGFGYRADDYGNTAATATPLSVGASGVIETASDVDAFSFNFPSGGVINLTVNPFYIGPDLDILAELYNGSNVLVTSSNPSSTLGATLNMTLSPGSYSLQISGVGKGDPLGTGYTDYDSLGQYSISGAFDALPATPVNPSPANGATGVDRVGLTLNWDDAAGATSYDVYLDDMFTAKANVTQSQWTISPQVLGGIHQWKVVAKNGIASASSATWTFAVPVMPTPATPSIGAPPNGPQIGEIKTNNTLVFDWDDSANASAYDLYIDSASVPVAGNLSSSTWTWSPGPIDKNFTWKVTAKNADGSVTGPIWNFSLDTTAPTASLQTANPSTGSTLLFFSVSYADNVSGLKTSTFDNSDVVVTGPHGYSAAASFFNVNNSANGTPRVVTYTIPAPGGFWNDVDNGVYTVTQQANQVTDVAGWPKAAGTIGTYTFSNLGFAWSSSDTLNVAFDDTGTPLTLGTSGTNISVTKNATTQIMAGVQSIHVLGSSVDDRLQINAPLTPPVSFVDSAGNDLLDIIGGAYTFNADIATASQNVAVHVAAGASATFNASQHLRSLSVDGSAALSAGGNKAITVTDLAVTGALNLGDNDLLWNTADSSAGATMNQLIQAHRILSDSASAMAGLGVSATPAAVMVKYTYIGDADLDGLITGDDFFAIDSGFAAQSPRYDQGDFNYSGAVDSDDYFLIDSNYNKSNVPL